ncbi:MAG: amino acid racemase [Prochloraceae cyanobacterium]|nr:amino acid racemase [Prochloraceae cyanobacterium]
MLLAVGLTVANLCNPPYLLLISSAIYLESMLRQKNKPLSNLTKQIAIPGILGGLGPLAHIEFELRLLKESAKRGSCCDQEYPVWILVSATDIPDRTKSLSGEAPDCVPHLVRYGKLLQKAGADFLIVTCNTAHVFYDRVQPQLDIPWVHLIESTIDTIVKQYPTVTQVGVLATSGTLSNSLYNSYLLQTGLIPVFPPLDSEIQNEVMQAIYSPEWGIKTTGSRVSEQVFQVLERAVFYLADRGAELVVAGCTELSIALSRMKNLPLKVVDPLSVAAKVSIDLAFDGTQLNSPQLNSQIAAA